MTVPLPAQPRPGARTPLGASWDGEGTNFALYAPNADGVELCLPSGASETRVSLTESTFGVHHGYLPGVGPGQRYGYRVSGPFAPHRGMRCNPAKLLLDPYARAIDGDLALDDALFGGTDAPDRRDSARYVPRSVVTRTDFPWGDDRPPATPDAETVVYELHVKGFTARHPGVPAQLRGTYAGLASPASVDHLLSLGVTAVELLPVQHFLSEPGVQRRGLRNFWGYNTIGFFAPHAAYAAAGSGGGQVHEFQAMVRTLHAAGLEVILDVVYNHTGEGGESGPTLSFRGIDNSVYYRLSSVDPARYNDVTGCGNTLDLSVPAVLQLVMDSLRFWVQEMHVDGFRFDLAPALTRSASGIEEHAAFLAAVRQDPVVGAVKLIAEPWDLGDGGYRVGRFPAPWAEWNDRYRNNVRDFWRGQGGGVADLACRLAGSSDMYGTRRPYSSVNFVTSHDGFPVRDLVTYDSKHNEANGEGNRDGDGHNRSWNCGVEGPTDDPAILALRSRQVRNLLGTLLLSTGMPMLLAGDEMGRTQGGNNNAYCQDNEISWLDWVPSSDHEELLGFVRRLIALRRRHPVLRQRTFFRGQPVDAGGVKDLTWFTPAGTEVAGGDWAVSTIGMYLCGDAIAARDARGNRLCDDSFLLLAHSGANPCEFRLPGPPYATGYTVAVDSAEPAGVEGAILPARSIFTVPGYSLSLLRARGTAGAPAV